MSTRKMKRFATIAAIAMIASCVAMPMAAMTASAAETTITITDGAENAVYGAYRLLDLTTSVNADDSVNYSYKLNDKYDDILKAVTKKDTQEEILTYLGSIEDKSGEARVFADAVYAAIKAAGLTVDETSSGGKFENVDQGYYLIAETTPGDATDTYSLVMLNTNGNTGVTVTTKENAPSMIKKVKDINDSTETEKSDWQDSADHDITDVVDFRLEGKVSDKYDNYKEYFYAFHDVCCEGLTVNYDSFAVYVDGAKITAGYEVVNTGLTDGCTFEVRFADLKKIDAVDADSVIAVEYTATLNDKAKLGSAGNPNEAFLEYSNNPYYVGMGDTDGDGKDDNSKDGIDNDKDGEIDEEDETNGEKETTSNSVKDKVIVFTYKTIVNKVMPDESTPLAGAKFKLEKLDAETGEYALVKEFTAGTETSFEFVGLDDGNYKLTETAAPAGYTQLTDPIQFSITAEHDEEADDPKLTKLNGVETTGQIDLGTLKANVDTAAGTITTKVVNKPGSLLPSTGGIGTTIFYVVGGTMAAGAGVYLISKKRMKKEEE